VNDKPQQFLTPAYVPPLGMLSGDRQTNRDDSHPPTRGRGAEVKRHHVGGRIILQKIPM
jgi:hypothetical protein